MITDNGINNYISNEILMNNEKSQNLISVEKPEKSQNLISVKKPAPKTDFTNIKSLNDLLHKYILQPNSNEFYIKFDSSDRWVMCMPIAVGGLIFGTMLSLLIRGSEDSGIIYCFIFIPGLAFFGGIIGFFLQRISVNIFLEEKCIRLVYTLSCFCRKTNVIKNGLVREFSLEGNIIKMKYCNIRIRDDIIGSRNFYEDEGHYLVYVLNNHLKKMSNNTSGETLYSNL